jgi:murein DD-endopeptidase MepM/ murein hydrolase activator NlpD
MTRRIFSCLALLLWAAGIWWWLEAHRPEVLVEAPARTNESYQDFFGKHFLPLLPVADGFDFPVRPPDGNGVYITRPFGADHHVGEDWNTAAGNGDLGEPVYSVADGWVSMAVDFESAWGKVILIVSRLPEGRWPAMVEVMYAHLGSLDVQPYAFVKRGQKIGTMGNVNGLYQAHLHWEVRQSVGMGLGGAFADKPDGWLTPSDFIIAHRPPGAGKAQMKLLPRKEWQKWGEDG